jgi:F-type H+-transporting ATPase subunit b
MLQLDLQQILSQAASFLLLLWILKRFAWKPLLAILDQRRALIEEELRQAAQQRAQLERLQQDYRQRLAAIEDEARSKIQQAVLEGKRIAVEIQEQARAQGLAILTKSKETVELELAKAREVLKGQVIEMTLEALERMMRQKLDPKADRQLVDEILGELESDRSRA